MECVMAQKPTQGNWVSSQVDLGYNELFRIPAVTSVSFCTCESVLGTLWSSIKQIKDLTCLIGNTELLCMQCSGIGPYLAARGKSQGFSQVAAGSWLTFSSYSGDGHSKLVFVQQCQDSCLVMRDTSVMSTRPGRAIMTLLEVRRETEGPFLDATVIWGFQSIFKKSQASSPFEELKSACLSRCQRDVSPPVQMSRGTRAFSRVSTGDSDIPSSCEMKDKPAFKALQGNPAFFQVRASRCTFHFSQQTQGPSHITTAERSLLLRC